MPKQISFAQAEYDAKRKTTRRDRFLGEMEIEVPWALLLEALRPHYYSEAGKGPGRPPIGLERMLRLYLLQQWFGLADEAWEDAVYGSQAFRGFLGLDLGREAAPASTKNQARARDPEMGHTRKGQQYYFGAKVHIGVDAESGLVHSTTITAANVADITATAHLLHGAEEAVFADAGYTGAEKR